MNITHIGGELIPDDHPGAFVYDGPMEPPDIARAAVDYVRGRGCVCEPEAEEIYHGRNESGAVVLAPVFAHDAWCPLLRALEPPVLVTGEEPGS